MVDYKYPDKWSVPPKTEFEKGLCKLFLSKSNPFIIINVEKKELSPDGPVHWVRLNLSSFSKWYNRHQDPRAVFTRAYERMTRAVLKKIQIRDRGFEHAIWLAALDATFAQYYFNALDAYEQPEAKAIETSKLWQMVFDFIGVDVASPTFPPKAMILEMLIVPMLVHMMHDLPLAIAELAVEEARFLNEVAQAPSSPEVIEKSIQQAQIPEFTCEAVHKLRAAGIPIRNFQQYAHDHEKVNDLLAEADYDVINAIQETTCSYSSLLLPWIDVLAKQYDEIATFNLIQLMRGKAWYEATRLVEANSIAEGEAIRRSIEEDTAALIKIFYDPSSQFRMALLQCARAVSGVFETWSLDSP